VHDRRVERAEVRAERTALVQRLQAPQLAVTEHYNRDLPLTTPPAVDMTDDGDEEFWEAKEAMAQRLAAEELREDAKDTLAMNRAVIDRAEAWQRDKPRG
jgi:hypothetical protein